jgi:hypothetical protein
MQRWMRFKSRYLIDFTNELTAKVRAIRGPQVSTARNIFAEPMLNPASEAWFAQNLDDFLGTYDWTAPMAMPLMEKQTQAQSGPWLEALVATVKNRPVRWIALCSNCRLATGQKRIRPISTARIWPTGWAASSVRARQLRLLPGQLPRQPAGPENLTACTLQQMEPMTCWIDC